MSTITVPVRIESTGFNRHDERHRFIVGAEFDPVSVAIIEEYDSIRDRFGGELEAVRAYLNDQGNLNPSADDVVEAANECYANYLTNDIEDQARNDQEVSGISESTAEWVEELLNDGDEFGDLEQFSCEGELDYGAIDLAQRVEMLESITYPLVDLITGKEYFFTI